MKRLTHTSTVSLKYLGPNVASIPSGRHIPINDHEIEPTDAPPAIFIAHPSERRGLISQWRGCAWHDPYATVEVRLV